uniref:Uncharacterized protein n=1 Tax=Arundo donax TaxID=35708 RepID=A0A0A9FYN8_ARUDO
MLVSWPLALFLRLLSLHMCHTIATRVLLANYIERSKGAHDT